MSLKSYLKILAICLGILTIEVIIVNSLGALNVGILGVILCIVDLIVVIGVTIYAKSTVKEVANEAEVIEEGK